MGTFFQIISMLILMGLAREVYNFHYLKIAMINKTQLNIWFWISAIGYGLGQGFNAPSLFAWASDTAGQEQRGRALAMLFMSLELGIIIGGLMVGYCILPPVIAAIDAHAHAVMSGGETHNLLQPSWDYFKIFGLNLLAFTGAFVFSVAQIIIARKK
jgi:MFS family permease